MYQYILYIPLLLGTGCGGDRQAIPDKEGIIPPAGYSLVWHDEFDAPERLPDAADWWFENGNYGWGNHELQNYVPGFYERDTTALVCDGSLKIIARKHGDEVISTRMNTKESWLYGYFEARLKLPKGKGTWPAFWMLSQPFENWPDDGEIDIMEEVGYRPNWVSATIHSKAYYHSTGTQKSQEKFVATAQDDFHTYAVEWTPDLIRAYLDGEVYFEFANDKTGNKDTWPFNRPFYLKLNLAWGGDWGGAQGVDESSLPAVYEIDYVRVFQKNDAR
jgi:beta-glucanase (GH16 family)